MAICKTYGCKAPVFKDNYCGKCFSKKEVRQTSDLTQNKIDHYNRKIRDLKKQIFECEIIIERLRK